MIATNKIVVLLNRLPMVLAAYPILCLALAYSFAVRARLALGYWPYPGHPDPSALGFSVHLQMLKFCSIVIPLVAGITIALAIFGRRAGVYHRIWPPLTFLVVSIGLLIGAAVIDPKHLIQWLIG